MQKKAVITGTDLSAHDIAHKHSPTKQDSDIGDLGAVWAWEGVCTLVFNKKSKSEKN